MAARNRAQWADGPARQVLARAFLLAGRAGTQCRPVHLAQALAEAGGAIGEALEPVRVEPPVDSRGGGGAGSSFVFGQTQGAAGVFAASRDEACGVAHLAVAMLDQHDAEMLRLLIDAGIDAGAVRRAALHQLGAPPDLPPVTLPALAPAGTRGRPALDVEQLDPGVWRVLVWRQEHLPLGRVRRAGQVAALTSLEQRAAWRVADKAGVDDDQRYSLAVHHQHAVEVRLASIQTRLDDPGPADTPTAGWTPAGGRRHRVPNFMVGWPTWFANRRVGIRDRWFRLSTAPAYRGQPGLDR